jgi:hypothetical protein
VLLFIVNLPDSCDRKQQYLDLQVTLASTLMEASGHTHLEVAEVLSLARGLIV